jgi:hypothetical protein
VRYYGGGVDEDQLGQIRRRIEHDFGEPRLEFAGLAFRPIAEWSGDPHDEDHLAVSGGHSFRVGRDEGVEQATVYVADRLQDDVVDQLWRPWPALLLPDAREAVLDPCLSEDGIAVWTTGAGYRCPIGRLHATFAPLLV